MIAVANICSITYEPSGFNKVACKIHRGQCTLSGDPYQLVPDIDQERVIGNKDCVDAALGYCQRLLQITPPTANVQTLNAETKRGRASFNILCLVEARWIVWVHDDSKYPHFRHNLP